MKQPHTASIPLVEERVRLSKRQVPSGKVRVRTIVDEVTEIAQATLLEESVDIRRVPVGKEIRSTPTIRTEGDVVIVPIVEEVLIVEKRLRLKEEIHIRRRIVPEPVKVPVSLRKQRAIVSRKRFDDTRRSAKTEGKRPRRKTDE